MSNLQTNTTDLQSILDAVNALPDAIDTSGVTATAGHVLAGDKFVDSSGKLKDGEMPNNGTISQTMDGVNTKSITVPAGYTSGGSVSLDSTIDNAVAAMKTALTDKGVTVPSDADALDIASLIAAIEAGGGGLVFANGTFTLSEDMYNISITHNLGIKPKFVIVFAFGGNVNITSGYIPLYIARPYNLTTLSGAYYAQQLNMWSSYVDGLYQNANTEISADGTTITINTFINRLFKSGQVYGWFMFG